MSRDNTITALAAAGLLVAGAAFAFTLRPGFALVAVACLADLAFTIARHEAGAPPEFPPCPPASSPSPSRPPPPPTP